MKLKIFVGTVLVLIVTSIVLFAWQDPPVKKRGGDSVQSALPAPTVLVSLGDSVAAGDGLPVTGTSSQANACGQSDEAYAVQVAQNKQLKLEQFACSGAKVTTGILDPQAVNNQSFTPQLTAAEPYLKYNDVLITIGANDVNWDNELLTCVISDCETSTDQAVYQQSLTTLSANLDTMLHYIANYHPHEVVLNTYYSLMNNSDTCLENQGITTSKIQWVNNLENELNATIQSAAAKYNDKTVAINFSGHLLCNQDPWIQGLGDPAPLHPTAAGQASIAVQDEQQF